MTKRTLIKGRQFSRRKVTQLTDEYGLTGEHWQISPPPLSFEKLPQVMADMLDIIRQAGIDTTGFEDDSGTLLVERVIHVLEHEGDSLPGLAALVYRDCAHVAAYVEYGITKSAVNYMAEAGRRLMLLRVYQQTTETARGAGDKSAKARASLANEIRQEARRLTRNGVAQRDQAAAIAKKLDVTPQHVRRILKAEK